MKNIFEAGGSIDPMPPTDDPTVVKDTFYATILKNFSPLVVKVKTNNGGIPVGGAVVQFKSVNPSKKAGATFKGCTTTNSMVLSSKPKTNADGIATADPLCANGNKSDPKDDPFFEVTATVLGNTQIKPARFSLQNLGQVAAPKVVELTEAAAKDAIKGAKLNVALAPAQPSNTTPAGSVISQNPKSDVNKPVDVGTTVTITVSSGK